MLIHECRGRQPGWPTRQARQCPNQGAGQHHGQRGQGPLAQWDARAS